MELANSSFGKSELLGAQDLRPKDNTATACVGRHTVGDNFEKEDTTLNTDDALKISVPSVQQGKQDATVQTTVQINPDLSDEQVGKSLVFINDGEANPDMEKILGVTTLEQMPQQLPDELPQEQPKQLPQEPSRELSQELAIEPPEELAHTSIEKFKSWPELTEESPVSLIHGGEEKLQVESARGQSQMMPQELSQQPLQEEGQQLQQEQQGQQDKQEQQLVLQQQQQQQQQLKPKQKRKPKQQERRNSEQQLLQQPLQSKTAQAAEFQKELNRNMTSSIISRNILQQNADDCNALDSEVSTSLGHTLEEWHDHDGEKSDATTIEADSMSRSMSRTMLATEVRKQIDSDARPATVPHIRSKSHADLKDFFGNDQMLPPLRKKRAENKEDKTKLALPLPLSAPSRIEQQQKQHGQEKQQKVNSHTNETDVKQGAALDGRWWWKGSPFKFDDSEDCNCAYTAGRDAARRHSALLAEPKWPDEEMQWQKEKRLKQKEKQQELLRREADLWQFVLGGRPKTTAGTLPSCVSLNSFSSSMKSKHANLNRSVQLSGSRSTSGKLPVLARPTLGVPSHLL